MTRKDYEKFAAILRGEIGQRSDPQTQATARIARKLAKEFKQDNPRFNLTKFFDACGLDKCGLVY